MSGRKSEIESALARTMEIILEHIEDSRDPSRPVSRSLSPSDLAKTLDLSLPDEGSDLGDLVPVIRQYVESSTKTGSPRFLNQLFSGNDVAGILGEMVVGATNTSMYTYEAAPVATLMENELIRRMSERVGFRGGDGIFVSGGSNANMVAMLTARHRIDAAAKRRGLAPGRRYKAFVSDQAHYSFLVAANLLGIGTEGIVRVATDDVGRMLPDELGAAIEREIRDGATPFFVAATAGTTVLGAFDPIEAIADIARGHDLWLHVDGAWGAPALFSDSHRHLIRGAERADSFAWDAHKLMGVPLVCTAILMREPGLLQAVCESAGTDYIYHDNPEESCDLGPMSLACGRRVDCLKLWLAWRHHGATGYAKRVDFLMDLARTTRELIDAHPRLELMAEPMFLNICFRYVPEVEASEEQLDELNRILRDRLTASGRALVNYALLDDRVTIRLVLPNPDLTEPILTTILEEIVEIGRAVEAEWCEAGDDAFLKTAI